jgi:hypothetical protein
MATSVAAIFLACREDVLDMVFCFLLLLFKKSLQPAESLSDPSSLAASGWAAAIQLISVGAHPPVTC